MTTLTPQPNSSSRDGKDVPWPMDVTSSQPVIFNPRGFLVVILEHTDEAKAAWRTLLRAGVGHGDLIIYSGAQILEDHERFVARRSLVKRVIGSFTDDCDTVDLYFAYARDGRAALWVRAEDKTFADEIVRELVNHLVLHFHYYGRHSQHDLHIR